MRVGIFGYGYVAAAHARQLGRLTEVELTAVYGPSLEKARQFASRYSIRTASDNVEEALSSVDAAIVCSPSHAHYDQTRILLDAGVHTLVELPPCSDSQSARELQETASRHGIVLQCAHTSRFLRAYQIVRKAVQEGLLGEISQIVYTRHLLPPPRSWKDDALHHHSMHALDLLLDWFGEVEPVSCMTFQAEGVVTSATLLLSLPNGASASVSISHTARLPRNLLVVVGTGHTLETDGFTLLRSDLGSLKYANDHTRSYFEAIRAQDLGFVQQCGGEVGGTDWSETVRLMANLDATRACQGRQ